MPYTDRQLAELRRRGIDPDTLNRADKRRLFGHRGLSEREKLNAGTPLNIWDAAKSYRLQSGDTRALRVVLHDPEFASAWRTFRGGAEGQGPNGERRSWFDLTDSQRRDRMRRGYVPTSFDEKMEAARILGWHGDEKQAIERLRNVSP